jgi:hypothetical protein
MKKIFIVEYSTGEYEDYRLRIAGVSDTRKGANDLRNQFLDLLKRFEKELKEKDFAYEVDNYELVSYNKDSISIKEYPCDTLITRIK